MTNPAAQSPPPDRLERQRALDPARSILVEAPAGSGKTDLLTRRFLRLLAEVEEPSQLVAITFTNAAAAEMRHRILAELEKAAANNAPDADKFSMASLAHRALLHSEALGWMLLDLPAQLRVRTIDSFCRELALQQPLLSGFGGSLEIAAQPDTLYRRAARETLRKIDESGSPLAASIEDLLLWRDNNWQDLEEQLVEMLASRDRWMHDFVLERDPDWYSLRERLERPFASALRDALTHLSQLLDQLPGARDEALALARFACEQSGRQLHQELAELAEFPAAPFTDFEDSRQAHADLAGLLLTTEGVFRRQIDKRLGFPADRKREKARLLELIAQLAAVPGLEASLAAVRALPPLRYTEDEWQIVRSSFILLRHAAAELQIVFAEAGAVDYIQIAQIAQRVLRGEDNLPTDAALALAGNIRHLLVDEFQDTSRRQHQLLSSLIAVWPELDPARIDRTCFLVGDPMQSIYSFREADAELFPRVKALGLEIPHEDPLLFDSVALTANFRTAPALVERLNQDFEKIFARNDGSGIIFTSAQSARDEAASPAPPFTLHLDFIPPSDPNAADEKEAARTRQLEEIVSLIHSYSDRIEAAKARGENFRVAVLGRAKNHLAPIAAALREAGIPFRSVELENLATRPEVLDALALARALLNPEDRVAWLGVLRAPWCGLSLEDLHTLAGPENTYSIPVPFDEETRTGFLYRSDEKTYRFPVRKMLNERQNSLSEAGKSVVSRLLQALDSAPKLRASQPSLTLGSWLEQLWLRLGGADCVDATQRANLNLFWSFIDRLPNGEEDLLGPGLDAALSKLTAMPDPEAASGSGVQLMTIHKAKGLEFEVVIVPELQAKVGGASRKMLSWLERGLLQPNDSEEITEFLIAPFQRKGADRSTVKAWVDCVYRERELQETRRILYVASTRAREELHLFASHNYKKIKGELVLAAASGSLLSAAWPALEAEIRARFESWNSFRINTNTHEEQIESIAASGEGNLLTMPSPLRPTLLRRLPTDYQQANFNLTPQPEHESAVTIQLKPLFIRHEGGLLSRALGTTVHTLLEELARLRMNLDWNAASEALQNQSPRVAAQARAAGLDRPQAERIVAEALEAALSASRDPIGAWILSPHTIASSEVRWSGVVSNSLRSIRVDRVFRAGPAPCAEGEDCWWIIDYKTAHANNLDPKAALPQLHELFAPQVEAYAELLRNLRGTEARIFAGLYYPRMLLLDWWEL